MRLAYAWGNVLKTCYITWLFYMTHDMTLPYKTLPHRMFDRTWLWLTFYVWHKYTHTLSLSLSHTHTHTRAHTHTHTHTRAHTYAHTHTHVHLCVSVFMCEVIKATSINLDNVTVSAMDAGACCRLSFNSRWLRLQWTLEHAVIQRRLSEDICVKRLLQSALGKTNRYVCVYIYVYVNMYIRIYPKCTWQDK